MWPSNQNVASAPPCLAEFEQPKTVINPENKDIPQRWDGYLLVVLGLAVTYEDVDPEGPATNQLRRNSMANVIPSRKSVQNYYADGNLASY